MAEATPPQVRARRSASDGGGGEKSSAGVSPGYDSSWGAPGAIIEQSPTPSTSPTLRYGYIAYQDRLPQGPPPAEYCPPSSPASRQLDRRQLPGRVPHQGIEGGADRQRSVALQTVVEVAEEARAAFDRLGMSAVPNVGAGLMGALAEREANGPSRTSRLRGGSRLKCEQEDHRVAHQAGGFDSLSHPARADALFGTYRLHRGPPPGRDMGRDFAVGDTPDAGPFRRAASPPDVEFAAERLSSRRRCSA